jgi:hypothetical protein
VNVNNHLTWIENKIDELSKQENNSDIVDMLLSMDATMKNFDNRELRDIVLYVVGRLNDKI